MKEIKVTGHGWWEGSLAFDTEEHEEDFDEEFFEDGVLARQSQFGRAALSEEIQYLFFDNGILKEEYQKEIRHSPNPYGCFTVCFPGFEAGSINEIKLYWRAIISCIFDGYWFMGWNDFVIQKIVNPLLLGAESGNFEEEITYRVETEIYWIEPFSGKVFVRNNLFPMQVETKFEYRNRIVYDYEEYEKFGTLLYRFRDDYDTLHENTHLFSDFLKKHPKLKQTVDEAVMEAVDNEILSLGKKEEDGIGEPLVGPFFYLRGCFITSGIPLSAARGQADKLDNPLSHEELFDSLRLKGDYIDYPRGRVIWDCTENRGIIYIDPCIRSQAEEIARRFRLKTYVVEEDEHYHCKNCANTILDKEWGHRGRDGIWTNQYLQDFMSWTS